MKNENNITSLQIPITDPESGEPLKDDNGEIIYRQITNPAEIEKLVSEVTKEQNAEKSRKQRLEQAAANELGTNWRNNRRADINEIKDPITGEVRRIYTYYINGELVNEHEYFKNTTCPYCETYHLKGQKDLEMHLKQKHGSYITDFKEIT